MPTPARTLVPVWKCPEMTTGIALPLHLTVTFWELNDPFVPRRRLLIVTALVKLPAPESELTVRRCTASGSNSASRFWRMSNRFLSTWYSIAAAT